MPWRRRVQVRNCSGAEQPHPPAPLGRPGEPSRACFQVPRAERHLPTPPLAGGVLPLALSVGSVQNDESSRGLAQRITPSRAVLLSLQRGTFPSTIEPN